MQQSTRHNLSKSRNNNPSKKPVHSKQDNLGNPVSRSKSNSTVNRENRNKKNPRQKSRSTMKNQLQNKAPSDEGLSLTEIIGNEELEDKMRMSEASQTTNDTKSAVVMEYSTVQKIVQILDDTDLVATKMVMKDLNNKQNLEEKKEPMIELQFEPQIISEFVSISEE
ncbi:PREDICTED: uncharacterized protein LOC108545587 [Eufriesea mexicana]|uniref:uncharacterized protein LOC108545587 n=1 Tax=Eufriesea mexicana TaxID=516756 RepID=UPI00083C7CAC|nr:PREDICTED: uncharacterized protein LOC108545587 [Eufriesea mexicana]